MEDMSLKEELQKDYGVHNVAHPKGIQKGNFDKGYFFFYIIFYSTIFPLFYYYYQYCQMGPLLFKDGVFVCPFVKGSYTFTINAGLRLQHSRVNQPPGRFSNPYAGSTTLRGIFPTLSPELQPCNDVQIHGAIHVVLFLMIDHRTSGVFFFFFMSRMIYRISFIDMLRYALDPLVPLIFYNFMQ